MMGAFVVLGTHPAYTMHCLTSTSRVSSLHPNAGTGSFTPVRRQCLSSADGRNAVPIALSSPSTEMVVVHGDSVFAGGQHSNICLDVFYIKASSIHAGAIVHAASEHCESVCWVY